MPRPLAAALLVLAAAIAAVTGGAGERLAIDEAWTVQILSRMLAGDVPYRDFFFGATPLSLALLYLGGLIAGAEAWVPRAINAASFIASAWIVLRIAARLDLPRAEWIALFAGLLAWMRPLPISCYTSLALVFLCATAEALLTGRAQMAAIVAGLAFASKQNVGIFALGLVLIFAPRDRLRAAAIFGAIAVLMIIPIAAYGALPAFIDYGFTNKTHYVASAWSLPSIDGLRHFEGGIGRWCYSLIAVLPLAAIFARSPIILGLAIAGIASAFPRFDRAHLVLAVPGALLAAVYATRTLRTRIPAAALAAVAILACAYGYLPTGLEAVNLPHYRNLLAAGLTPIRARVQSLATWSGPEPLFLQTPDASLLYLATGRRNPTPFDYPLRTAFGRTGEANMIDSLQSGRIPCILIDPGELPELMPTAIVRHAEQTMSVRATLAAGVVRCRVESAP